MRRFLVLLFMLGLLLALGAGGYVLWWLDRPLKLAQPQIDLSIEKGTLPRGVAEAVGKSGVAVDPRLLYGWFRLSGQGRKIKAGNYEIEAGVTPRSLLQLLVRGEEAVRSFTLVEGWNFRQVRAALSKAEQLNTTVLAESDENIMKSLGRDGTHPEGRFFPDTYTYAKGSTDLALLARALRAMDRRLAAAWEQRSADASVKTPEEALILASIVEKETGAAVDRAHISSVLNNRLRINMPLQTDPTVIYGMGESFDGNLRKKDLHTDTPWNTYTRSGLPPTPISMPGEAALLAAVKPADSKALYFVARGDGSSQFSETLSDHNRAVNQFQRGRRD
ncbi:MAG: endolytic transglycosylase MltG [Burkholderiales bacterium]